MSKVRIYVYLHNNVLIPNATSHIPQLFAERDMAYNEQTSCLIIYCHRINNFQITDGNAFLDNGLQMAVKKQDFVI